MKLYYWAITLMLIIGCTTDDNYGSLQIESNIDTTLARIGDVLNFDVRTHFSKDQIIDFPDILDTESMEVRSKTVHKKNDIAHMVNFEIVYWDTGKFVIPEYAVRFLKPDSTIEFTMKTDSVTVTVISMLAGSEDRNIRPIKEPVPIKEPLNWYKIILVMILLILILVFIGLWSRRHKRSELTKISVSKNQSAIDIAMKRLIDTEGILSIDNKKFYLHLSFLIREFLENQFYIRALEMTTKEIRSFENKIRIQTAEFKGMMNILNRADLAKFAKYDFSISERKSDIKWMQKFLLTFEKPEL